MGERLNLLTPVSASCYTGRVLLFLREAMVATETEARPTDRVRQLPLLAILLLAALLRTIRLGRVGTNGFGSGYYAAAVQTMLTSWRHFLYLSVDPAGFVAVDKPPLALWIQTASAHCRRRRWSNPDSNAAAATAPAGTRYGSNVRMTARRSGSCSSRRDGPKLYP